MTEIFDNIIAKGQFSLLCNVFYIFKNLIFNINIDTVYAKNML